MITEAKRSIQVKSKEKTSKTWLIAPEEKNGVYIIKTTSLQAQCGLSSLSFSDDGLNYQPELCSGRSSVAGGGGGTKAAVVNKNEIQIYPTSRQLWIKFDVAITSSHMQHAQLSYFTLSLSEYLTNASR